MESIADGFYPSAIRWIFAAFIFPAYLLGI